MGSLSLSSSEEDYDSDSENLLCKEYDYKYNDSDEESEEVKSTIVRLAPERIASAEARQAMFSQIASIDRGVAIREYKCPRSSFLQCPKGGVASTSYWRRVNPGRFLHCPVTHMHGNFIRKLPFSVKPSRPLPSWRRPTHFKDRPLKRMLTECRDCDKLYFTHHKDADQHHMDYLIQKTYQRHGMLAKTWPEWAKELTDAMNNGVVIYDYGNSKAKKKLKLKVNTKKAKKPKSTQDTKSCENENTKNTDAEVAAISPGKTGEVKGNKIGKAGEMKGNKTTKKNIPASDSSDMSYLSQSIKEIIHDHNMNVASKAQKSSVAIKSQKLSGPTKIKAQKRTEPLKAQKLNEPVKAQSLSELVKAHKLSGHFKAHKLSGPAKAQTLSELVKAQKMSEPVKAQKLSEPLNAKKLARPVKAKKVSGPSKPRKPKKVKVIRSTHSIGRFINVKCKVDTKPPACLRKKAKKPRKLIDSAAVDRKRAKRVSDDARKLMAILAEKIALEIQRSKLSPYLSMPDDW